MDELPVDPWTLDDTERWLSQYPLPVDFRWEKTARNPDGTKTLRPDCLVLPDYKIKKGYGFWLRTGPAFPGLFEEIHGILWRAPIDQPLSPDWVAQQLLERKRANGTQGELMLTTDGPGQTPR